MSIGEPEVSNKARAIEDMTDTIAMAAKIVSACPSGNILIFDVTKGKLSTFSELLVVDTQRRKSVEVTLDL